MTLLTASYTAVLAAASAFLFALVLLLSRLSGILPRGRHVYEARLSGVAGGDATRRWRSVGRLRRLYVLPLVHFILAGVALTLAEPAVPPLDLPAWLPVLLLVLVALAALVCLGMALRLTAKRIRLRRTVDARLTIGQALQRIAMNRNRSFHDVPTAFGGIDHVIAGLHGIYAVKVIARKPGRDRRLTLDGDRLQFGETGAGASIEQARKVADRLARECGKVLGHAVHVRLIIAAPGWEVHAQARDDVLLANERNLTMLTGWKDQRDYLLDEDVDALHAYLDARCARDLKDFR